MTEAEVKAYLGKRVYLTDKSLYINNGEYILKSAKKRIFYDGRIVIMVLLQECKRQNSYLHTDAKYIHKEKTKKDEYI